MYRKIIVGFDARPASDDALALGKLISETTGAELIVAGVFQYDPIWGGRDPAFQDIEREYARSIEQAAESVGAQSEAIPSSSPARGLHELAEESGADLVVVGSSSQSKLGQVLGGNVALSLLLGSPCSVAVAPRGFSEQGPEAIAEISVGYDGSPESLLAVHDSIELARASGATLHLITVAEPPPIGYSKGGGANQGWHELKDEIEKLMRSRLDEVLGSLPEDVQTKGTLISGEPVESLAGAATADGGLLVLGSRGYGPLRGVLLGSVSRALMRSAPCAVVVHPRGVADEASVAHAAGDVEAAP